MAKPETEGGVPTSLLNDSADKLPANAITQGTPVEIDDCKSTAQYANFCRLSGTPEELLMDFGLNPLPTGATTQKAMVTQRVVTEWHTAKRWYTSCNTLSNATKPFLGFWRQMHTNAFDECR